MRTMEDDDDEEYFEVLVYGQGKTDQDAAEKIKFKSHRRTVKGGKPVQDNAKFENADTD